jgi:hypothetical protein
MTALFLLLIIVAIALGIVGVVAKGLLYLLIIGIVVFLGALLPGALRMRRRPQSPGQVAPGPVPGGRSCRRPGRARPTRQRAAPSWSSGYRRRRRPRP